MTLQGFLWPHVGAVHDHYCEEHDHRWVCRDAPCLRHEAIGCGDAWRAPCPCGRAMRRVDGGTWECSAYWRGPGHARLVERSDPNPSNPEASAGAGVSHA